MVAGGRGPERSGCKSDTAGSAVTSSSWASSNATGLVTNHGSATSNDQRKIGRSRAKAPASGRKDALLNQRRFPRPAGRSPQVATTELLKMLPSPAPIRRDQNDSPSIPSLLSQTNCCVGLITSLTLCRPRSDSSGKQLRGCFPTFELPAATSYFRRLSWVQALPGYITL